MSTTYAYKQEKLDSLSWERDSLKLHVEAHLREDKAHFRGLNLNSGVLSLANFAEADLRGTFFMHGTLYMADFWHADLEGANFHHADLVNANLEGANLKYANLEGANLDGAKLSGVVLEGANLKDTKF